MRSNGKWRPAFARFRRGEKRLDHRSWTGFRFAVQACRTDPAIAVGLLGAEPLAERSPAQLPEPGPALGSAAGRAEAALRSAHEVRGFPLAATDGDIGHVEDLLVDEDGWFVRYFIVDTGNWLPGRKVLIAPSWVTGIDWIEEKLAVRMTREKVEGSPEYAPEKQIDRRYEHDLHAWYGHAPYW